jgi:hypothetical protein
VTGLARVAMSHTVVAVICHLFECENYHLSKRIHTSIARRARVSYRARERSAALGYFTLGYAFITANAVVRKLFNLFHLFMLLNNICFYCSRTAAKRVAAYPCEAVIVNVLLDKSSKTNSASAIPT